MPKSKGDLRVIKTRAVIRSALVEIMAEKELKKITITEICSRACINRKTFYRHYREISDVVSDIENEILSEFSEHIKEGSALSVEMVVRGISETIKRKSDFFLRLMKNNPDVFSGGRIKSALCKAAAAALKSTASCDEQTLRAAAEFAVSGILALYSAWFDGSFGESLDFITEITAKMTAKGFGAFSA